MLQTPAVQDLARRLEGGGNLSVRGVDRAAQSFVAVLVQKLCPHRPVIVVLDALKAQESVKQDLTTWLGCEVVEGRGAPRAPLFYPAWEIFPHEARLPHADVIGERLQTLMSLQAAADSQPAPLLVASVAALMQRTFRGETLRQHTRTLSRGDRLGPLDLVEWLEDQGYEPEAQVTQMGELALRGGILDVYPPTSPWPVRLEFFGDELESLRHFDPLTQISREAIEAVSVPPAGELGILKRARSAESVVGSGAGERERSGPPVRLGTLLDYLPPAPIFLICEPEMVEERAEEYASQVPHDDPFIISWGDFQAEAQAAGAVLVDLAEAEPEPAEDSAPRTPHSALELPSLDAFRPLQERAPDPQIAEAQRREFFAQLHRWLRQDYQVHVFCNNDGERQRFLEIWQEYGLADAPADPPRARAPNRKEDEDENEEEDDLGGGTQSRPGEPGLALHLGALARGFLCEAARVVVVTDAEIFGRYKMQRPRRLKSPHAQATRSALDIDFTELEEGDYVVHLQHGIGRYLGLQVLAEGAGARPTAGAPGAVRAGQECLVLEYGVSDPADSPPKLYVPVTEAHLVSKYVGVGKARPALSILGGARWAKAKQQAERAVRDVASELLAIQAARESQAGHAFPADTAWQREFEGAFIFEETPDQMGAIVAAKADMERPKPMDRLICGDVGFGKTEVGIRAAFKAVMGGKQVALLVPTTVLAQQHFNTFRERMADYPVRIELLSRFRTRGAQQRVISDLAAGAVDIVIGTHRLLQPDIGFKDLGLVVIDEEQRFGVLHKEKFKMLRKLVDVLTLSATPIPRTLYLALTGARDMSTIQTPPQDRLPVETIVTQYDERLIRDAIQRELNRGGQVFFLHNRVMTIETVAAKLRDLLPHARIAVGHGQMHADDLEEVMTKFVNGEADVLLSTTIIESGLDIPNANTIIIDRADRFGLSDLYQLRGRVGRYKHQAYAYFLLPRHAGLLTDVRKRMSAIKQYSTLGSGFKIAMRDLEIRGAGNLLGAEQSGHITAVGFELYCQLLKQSVASLKGEKVKPRVEVRISLDFLALSPTDEARGKPAEVQTGADGALIVPALGGSPTLTPKGGTTSPRPSPLAAASIPLRYISDTRQRIEIYRKLAQATDKNEVQNLEREIRDRFGPVPDALKLLLQVTELRVLASERAVTAIEVREDKLMLTRNGDYVMVEDKFPRLNGKTAPARLKEIKRLLLAV
jgi:transcription-repair coupling factor (superfamily II helicase)